MDHHDVRDLLEDAAVEPGGLERLMAGDTPTAAVVAGHLAGCPECTQEMDRLRRTVGVIRPAVQAVPPPELRQRTLEYVAAVGRPRGATTAAAAPAPQPATIAAAKARHASAGRSSAGRWFVAGLVAAVIAVAVFGAGFLAGGTGLGGGNASQVAEIEALGDVARWTMRVDGQPDARRVTLANAPGAQTNVTNATLLFSPTSKELVVVADQLAPPPTGKEYRCWVEVGGVRKPIGKMFFGGNLAYWVGPVNAVAGLPADATFGVSLVDLSATDRPGQPVLVGEG